MLNLNIAQTEREKNSLEADMLTGWKPKIDIPAPIE